MGYCANLPSHGGQSWKDLIVSGTQSMPSWHHPTSSWAAWDQSAPTNLGSTVIGIFITPVAVNIRNLRPCLLG